MIQKINFKIEGVSNKTSQAEVEAGVEILPGVESININTKTGSASLRFDEEKISRKEIFKEIEESRCKVIETGNKNNKPKKMNPFIGITVAVIVIIVLISVLSGSKGEETESANQAQIPTTKKIAKQVNEKSDGFVGEKGLAVVAKGGQIFLDESSVNDGDLHAFNYFSEKEGKNIYFFVVKASDGTYRVAANACEVCFEAKKGFRQVGNMIQCDNCKIKYPKDKIAKEKGGCNPGPITDDAPVKGGKLVIELEDVEAVSYLF